MKYLFIILFLLIPELIIAQQDSIISINLRIGDSISVDEKQYFGLFPKIIGYQSAKLFYNKSENIYYFNIQTSNKIEKMIVSDTLVAEFKNFIEKYEELVNQNRDKEIKINPILKKDLVKVPVYYKTKVKKPTISLLDGEILKWYVVYHNDSCMVISPTNYVNNFRSIKRNFRIINYNEIDTMTFLEYPIIKGKKLIFDLNFNSLDSLSMFYNVDTIIAPELKSFLETKRVYPLIWDTLDFDFDEIYSKKHNFAIYYGKSNYFLNAFQGINRILNIPLYGGNSILSLIDYDSYSIDYNYSAFHPISFTLGLSINTFKIRRILPYGSFHFDYENFKSTSLNIDVLYNFWQLKKLKFQDYQLFTDIYLGLKISNFQNEIKWVDKSEINSDLNSYLSNDITNSIKFDNYIGIKISFKVIDKLILHLKCHLDYSNLSGHLITNFNYISEKIDNLYSYGYNFGLGISL